MANLFAKHRAKKRSEATKKARKASLSGDEESRPFESSNSAALVEQRSNTPSDGLELKVNGLSYEGRGVARHKGKAQFIENALPGERVKARILSHKSRFDELVATEVLEASADRVDPVCEVYDRCGGCSLQHMRHGAQIIHRQTTLSEHFASVDLTPDSMLEPLSGSAFNYRSRARISIDARAKNTQPLLGFREKSGKDIINLNTCPLLSESISDFAWVRRILDCINQVKSVGHVELIDHNGQAVLLIRLIKAIDDGDLEKMISEAKKLDCTLYLQRAKEKLAHKIWPNDSGELLNYSLGIDAEGLRINENLKINEDQRIDIDLSFHPGDFTQVNRQVNELMVNKVIEILELDQTKRVLDLFCGLGNFTIPLAHFCAEIVGVEGSSDMVNRADDNAKKNAILNARFFEADLFSDYLSYDWAQEAYDVILLDPPRAGAKLLAKQIGHFNAKQIVYISCNPATLARDAREIVDQGYQLDAAGILDMFPQTSHTESIAIFTK